MSYSVQQWLKLLRVYRYFEHYERAATLEQRNDAACAYCLAATDYRRAMNGGTGA